jgi:hypothetical protein
VLNAVLVLMLTTSIVGPLLTERFAPRLVVTATKMHGEATLEEAPGSPPA